MNSVANRCCRAIFSSRCNPLFPPFSLNGITLHRYFNPGSEFMHKRNAKWWWGSIKILRIFHEFSVFFLPFTSFRSMTNNTRASRHLVCKEGNYYLIIIIIKKRGWVFMGICAYRKEINLQLMINLLMI